jgi:hypothetical protein
MENVVETYRKQFVLRGVAALAVIGGLAGRASAQDRLVQESRDPNTGSVAKLYLTAHGPRIDLLGAGLQIRKEAVEGRVRTTITSGRDSLIIDAGPERVSVTAKGRTVVATTKNPAPLATTKRLVAESPLAARAATLIAKLGFGDRSPLQPLLLTTRAFLLAARDDTSGGRELAAWITRTRSAAHVVPAAFGQKTPTECWNAYGDELVDAYTEYVQCFQAIRWYTVFGPERCGAIYEMRILGAFTWWASCVSLRTAAN